ncbi:hypothetical protein T01_7864 [Trichinella spiralis]|uniref:SCAN domain-containing protein 3 n=1 Tax=Trichinella spiralis TaxID=6334 RepID=A0A0V1AI73_TRISP|nr:hypothetical protein T01_7864 [Trichinella spiralis]
MEKFLLALPSSYLVERGFSVVTDFQTKKSNRLQIDKRGGRLKNICLSSGR